MPATPYALPDQVNPFENLPNVHSTENTKRKGPLKVDIAAACNINLEPVSEEQTVLFQNEKNNLQQETVTCTDIHPHKMRRRKTCRNKLCKYSKKTVFSVFISTLVFVIFILINNLTNGSIINTGDIDRHHVEDDSSAEKTESQLLGATQITYRPESAQTKPPGVKNDTSKDQDIGIHMYLDTVCLREKGTTLMFKRIDSDLEGFKRDSVRYNNGYFTIRTSGYYFVHGLLTVRPTKKMEEPVKFHYCLNMLMSRTICRRTQEQAGWIGTVNIVESRLYLRKGERIKVTVSDMSYVYDGVYDTTFSVRLLQSHQK